MIHFKLLFLSSTFMIGMLCATGFAASQDAASQEETPLRRSMVAADPDLIEADIAFRPRADSNGSIISPLDADITSRPRANSNESRVTQRFNENRQRFGSTNRTFSAVDLGQADSRMSVQQRKGYFENEMRRSAETWGSKQNGTSTKTFKPVTESAEVPRASPAQLAAGVVVGEGGLERAMRETTPTFTTMRRSTSDSTIRSPKVKRCSTSDYYVAIKDCLMKDEQKALRDFLDKNAARNIKGRSIRKPLKDLMEAFYDAEHSVKELSTKKSESSSPSKTQALSTAKAEQAKALEALQRKIAELKVAPDTKED